MEPLRRSVYSEGVNLEVLTEDEGDDEAIIEAIAEALDEAGVTPEELAEAVSEAH